MSAHICLSCMHCDAGTNFGDCPYQLEKDFVGHGKTDQEHNVTECDKYSRYKEEFNRE